MKRILKSWKTTLGGLLFVLPVVVPVLAPYKDVIQGAAALLLGTSAADDKSGDGEKKN